MRNLMRSAKGLGFGTLNNMRSATRDDCRILITGAGGFIGSHVTELLLREGHRVRALARYNGRGDTGHLRHIPQSLGASLEVRLGDVTDPFLMRDLVADCDIVFHLAALIGIPYSYIAPASYLAINANGTLNVLEACRQAKTPRVIVTSTSEVYGTALYTPIDEKHPLQGQSPYSASKIAADKLAEAYYRSFDLPVVTLRPFNTYGPRQSARAVIPTVLAQALKGAKEIELGNLTPQRDLTFVTDTARAFVLAATASGIEGETIHFGQGSAISIQELAELCLQAAGRTARLVSVGQRSRPEKSEVDLLLSDSSKAKELLGWAPKVALLDGLRATVEYVRNHINRYDAGGYVV
jgi:NAD dependent epimerase/dehydratase